MCFKLDILFIIIYESNINLILLNNNKRKVIIGFLLTFIKVLYYYTNFNYF